MTVYMYISSQMREGIPASGEYGFEQDKDLCLFSSRHKALVHYYKENLSSLRDKKNFILFEQIDINNNFSLEKFYDCIQDLFSKEDLIYGAPEIIDLELDLF